MKKGILYILMLTVLAGCSSANIEKNINAVTLIRNEDSISITANENFYGGEIVINYEIKPSNVSAGENIPKLSIEIKDGKTKIIFINDKEEIAAGEEIFKIEKCKENIKIEEVKVVGYVETIKKLK